MPELILPGVYIEVRPEALIVPGPIAVGNIGISGTAGQGPVGEVMSLGSFSEAKQVFGAYDAFDNPQVPNQPLTLIRALELAYMNGASTVFAVRVTSTELAGASNNFIAAWGVYTKARKATFAVDGETAGTVCATLSAATHGSWGNSIAVNVFDADNDSFIVNEKHPGPAPIKLKRTPTAPNPRNQIRVVLAATGQTKVFSVVYSPTAPTAGQVQINVATGELTFAAGEAPVAADILYASYVVPKNNSRKVSIRFGAVTEVYTVADGQHLVDQVNDQNSPSALVTGAAGPNPGERPKKYAAADDFREFGKGTDTPGSNGADASASDYKLGLDQLLNEDAQIILAAGQDDTVIAAVGLPAHVEVASTDKIKRDRIGVVGSKANATLDDILGHTVASDRMIFVAPGIQANDSVSGKVVDLPGSYAAAVIAGMLSAVDPQVSLTNKTLSVVGLDERKFTLTPDKLEQMVQAQVLALEKRNGFRVVKGITTDTGAFRQITTRRIVDFAKFGVRSAADPYIGLLNNDRVRKALKGSINGFLARMVDDEQLESYELDVTATRDQEIQGIAEVTMTLRPTFSIDYIKVVMFLG